MFAGRLQVTRDPHRSCGHDFEITEVAASFLRSFAYKAQAPFDQVGVGELEDHAVADSSGGSQGFRPVPGDPHGGNTRVRPRKTCADALVVNRFAGIQRAKDSYKLAQVFQSRGFLSKYPARTIAAADAKLHASVRKLIQSRE